MEFLWKAKGNMSRQIVIPPLAPADRSCSREVKLIRLLPRNASPLPYPVLVERVKNTWGKTKTKTKTKQKPKDASYAHTKEGRTSNRKKNTRKISKPLSHPAPNFPFCATIRGFSVCLG